LSYLDIPCARLYYEVDGEGPPVLLVHAGVAHLRMWDEQVAAWRDRFKIIRYDQRGFGKTTCDDQPYSNRDDIRRLLEEVGVDRASVVGLSRGGQIATDFTIEFPDRVNALVAVASGLGGHQMPDDGVDWDEIDRLETGKQWHELVERETQIWTDGIGQPTTRVAAEVRRRMVEWNLENYLAEQPASQAQPLIPAAADRLGEIRVPTLAMWGTLDTPGVISACERIAAEVPGARKHVFDGVAHMVNLERPAEFNQLVGDFVGEAAA
jgi:pimeloyl-ACP methyl ester carboxylesterase